MKTKMVVTVLLALFLIMAMSGCGALPGEPGAALTASGVVEAVEVSAAAEVSGSVIEVHAFEGDTVVAGQPLFLLENEILQAQHDQAVAAYETAQAYLSAAEAGLNSAESNLDAAKVGLELANINYSMILMQANRAEIPLRENSWNKDMPSTFELPSWYFIRGEEISALAAQIENAKADLSIEQENLADVLENVSNADFRNAEVRLAEAQAAYLVADKLLDRDIEADGREAVDDYVQMIFDSAKAELDSAQAGYDSLLSTEKAAEVLEARARVSVAQERYFVALTLAYGLQTGEDSLEVAGAALAVDQAGSFVSIAEGAVAQAEAAVTVSEKALNQAASALDIIKTQIEKLTVKAPTSGVILASTVEVGELVQPGVTAFVVGQLEELSITVYLPEDIYGLVTLGDLAEVQVDSFPGTFFQAEVTKIADKAEYTPRNVQTEEDRSTTVFAIKLSVVDHEGKLKPGMPADVTFNQ